VLKILSSVLCRTGRLNQTVAEVVGESDQDGIIFRDEPAVAGIGVQEPDCQPCVNTESTIRI